MHVLSFLVSLILAVAVIGGSATAQADDPVASTFYKAFWLERGERRFDEAAKLYQEFLIAAPDHALAGQAARLRFELLVRIGRKEEAKSFAEEHAAHLGGAQVGAPAGGSRARGAARPEGEPADRAASLRRGVVGDVTDQDGPRSAAERGSRSDRAAGPEQQERMAALREQLAEARESGDEERAAQILRQVQRLERGDGRGSFGGRARNPIFGDTSIADMTEEQRDQLKSGLQGMGRMMEMVRRAMSEEQMAILEADVKAMVEALEAGKMAEAQAALDKVRKNLPRRGRRGGG
jgi:tetratricopeptide (TPR) repeat protein